MHIKVESNNIWIYLYLYICKYLYAKQWVQRKEEKWNCYFITLSCLSEILWKYKIYRLFSRQEISHTCFVLSQPDNPLRTSIVFLLKLSQNIIRSPQKAYISSVVLFSSFCSWFLELMNYEYSSAKAVQDLVFRNNFIKIFNNFPPKQAVLPKQKSRLSLRDFLTGGPV